MLVFSTGKPDCVEALSACELLWSPYKEGVNILSKQNTGQAGHLQIINPQHMTDILKSSSINNINK